MSLQPQVAARSICRTFGRDTTSFLGRERKVLGGIRQSRGLGQSHARADLSRPGGRRTFHNPQRAARRVFIQREGKRLGPPFWMLLSPMLQGPVGKPDAKHPFHRRVPSRWSALPVARAIATIPRASGALRQPVAVGPENGCQPRRDLPARWPAERTAPGCPTLRPPIANAARPAWAPVATSRGRPPRR